MAKQTEGMDEFDLAAADEGKAMRTHEGPRKGKIGKRKPCVPSFKKKFRVNVKASGFARKAA